MKVQCMLIVMVSLFFMGCAAQPPAAPQTTKSPESTMVGADRDEAGCIPSAGYSWCKRTKQCERPWELAAKVGIENTQEAFKTYCGN